LQTTIAAEIANSCFTSLVEQVNAGEHGYAFHQSSELGMEFSQLFYFFILSSILSKDRVVQKDKPAIVLPTHIHTTQKKYDEGIHLLLEVQRAALLCTDCKTH